MRLSSPWSRTAVVLGMLGAVLGTPEPFGTASDAEAALVCQHPRKPRARLRARACRKKEATVFDTAAVNARLAALDCIAASDLPRCRVGGRSYGRCSALDGNPTACALTYEYTPLFGTQVCWYDAGPGDCNGCDPVDEAEGRCTNGC